MTQAARLGWSAQESRARVVWTSRKTLTPRPSSWNCHQTGEHSCAPPSPLFTSQLCVSFLFLFILYIMLWWNNNRFETYCRSVITPIFAVIRQHLHWLGCLRKMQLLQTIALWTMPGVEQRHITFFFLLRGSCMKATWRMPCVQVQHHKHFTHR